MGLANKFSAVYHARSRWIATFSHPHRPQPTPSRVLPNSGSADPSRTRLGTARLSDDLPSRLTATVGCESAVCRSPYRNRAASRNL